MTQLSYHNPKPPKFRGTAGEKKRNTFIHAIGVCIVTGKWGGIDSAHVRMADSRFQKDFAGIGAKPHYDWTLPLSKTEHQKQHSMGEYAYWKQAGFNPENMLLSPLAMCVHLTGFHKDNDVEGARAFVIQQSVRARNYGS